MNVESVSRIADHLAELLDSADAEIRYKQDKVDDARNALEYALDGLRNAKYFKNDLLNTIDVLHDYEDKNA